MKSHAAFLLAFATVVPAIAAGPSANRSESPSTVAAHLIAEYGSAMRKKDLAYFQSHGTKDFTYINAKGQKAGMEQALAGIKSGFAMMTTIHRLDQKIVSAKAAEGGVLYVSDIKLAATLAMPSQVNKKKPAELVSAMRVETLAVKQGGIWKYKRVREISSKDVVDGKPFSMG